MNHILKPILLSFFLFPFLAFSQNDPAANQKNKASNSRNRIMPNQSAQMQNNPNDYYLEDRNQSRKGQERQSSSYQGMPSRESIMHARKNNSHHVAKNEGNMDARTLDVRAQMRKQQNITSSSYSGDILSSSLAIRNLNRRNKSHEMATYQGDIIVHGRKKGQHPSAIYRGGKIKNSYTAKEKYRKRMLKKYGRQTDVERPEEKKESKPRYDRNEADIWNK